MSTFTPKRIGNMSARAIVLIIAVFLSTSILASFFFLQSRNVTRQGLLDQLTNLAAISALHFDADTIELIHNQNDISSPAYEKTVATLAKIKNKLPNVAYVYLMRRTADPMTLSFVADADAYNASGHIDANANGAIDPEEELSLPGDSYDISDVPALQSEAFLRPTADQEITTDQWGTFVSAYAPVFDESGNAVAILGIDMNAAQFLARSESIFRPAAFLLVILLGLFFSCYIAVIIWRRRVETLREFDAERGALINLAMHQLGAPLAIFRWWVEILHEKGACDINPEYREICSQIDEGVARMSEVMSALRDVSAGDDVSGSQLTEEIDVVSVIDDVTKEYTQRMKDKSLGVAVECDPDAARMKTSRRFLAGILREIIGNAVDYSSNGGAIRVRVSRSRGPLVRFDVEDEGCGIPADDLPRLFQQFTRAANATKQKPVGNGVGLYFVQRMIQKAGGKIWLKSELAKGTTVSFTIPDNTHI